MNPHSLLRAARPLIDAALAEDLAQGDASSDPLFPEEHRSRARIVAREPLVIAGLPLVDAVFQAVDPAIPSGIRLRDGESIDAGTLLWETTGSTRSLLQAERTALNFIQFLSGIATATARLVAAAREGAPEVRICDTRKTLPGYRLLSKYAVRCGGGSNHRFSLSDGIMIKDNHIAAAGSIRAAVETLRRNNPHTLRIEVEADSLEQAREAALAGADIILLDNMDPETLRRAVCELGDQVVLEASGGITLESISEVAATGVDIISVGAITHSAPAVDLSLELHPIP